MNMPAYDRSLIPTLSRRPILSRLLTVCMLATVVICDWNDSARAQVSLTGISYGQSFDGMGNSSTTNNLPTGWEFGSMGGAFSAGTTATTQGKGTTGTNAFGSSSAGGAYMMVNGVLASGTDKAIGFLTSGSFATNRDVLFGFTNNTGQTISSLSFGWDYEKYRSGTTTNDWTFFTSIDGTNWGSAISDGAQSYSADANTTTVYNPPLTTSTKSVTVGGLSLAVGSSYYLRWNYTGSASTSAQALAIDDFTLSALTVLAAVLSRACASRAANFPSPRCSARATR
jgi:hypothetical protein